jgi:hypothetical protein
MKERRRIAIFRNALLVLFFIWFGSNDSLLAKLDRLPGSGNVTWLVELYSDNKDYIEVSIDATNVHPESTVLEVFFDVAFFAANGARLGTKRYSFTNSSLKEMESGYVHRKWFTHPYPGASSATGTCLYYAIASSALRQGYPTRFYLKRMNSALRNSSGKVKTY